MVDKYVKNFKDDETGIKALESVLGKSIKEINREWLKWVNSLTFDRPKRRPGGAWMGADFVQLPKGKVVLARVAIDGPADKAGLREGDTILQINGADIRDKTFLMKKVLECKPGAVAALRVKRGSQKKTLGVTLGREPAKSR